MNLLGSFIQSPLIQAVGEALLHSLWQAMLLALALALTLSVMRRASAALRCRDHCPGGLRCITHRHLSGVVAQFHHRPTSNRESASESILGKRAGYRPDFAASSDVANGR